MKSRTVFVFVLAALGGAVGCDESGGRGILIHSDSDRFGDTGTGEETGDTGAADSAADTSQPVDTGLQPGADGGLDTGQYSDTEEKICANWDVPIERQPVRIMLLEDKSTSMDQDNKWNLAVEAITGLVEAFQDEIAFGLDLFPAGGGAFGATRCLVGTEVLNDVALSNGDLILQTINTTSLSSGTPLLQAMMNFATPDYAPIFSNQEAESYLVIISDGADSCGLDGATGFPVTTATPEELSDITGALLVDHQIRTIVIGFGTGASPEQLNAIAAAGGTEFSEYLQADDGAQLAEALNSIATSVVLSCTYDLGAYDPQEVDINTVNFYFDDIGVPYDPDCAADLGWKWKDDDKTGVEFCGQACEQLEVGTVERISATMGCPRIDVV